MGVFSACLFNRECIRPQGSDFDWQTSPFAGKGGTLTLHERLIVGRKILSGRCCPEP
jgi:hypothetical protein